MKECVAIVTGGAGHIGSETCTSLARRGVQMVIVDKNPEKGEELARKLKGEFSVEALFLDLDLMEEKAFAHIQGAVKKRFGRLDFLVNNAAFYDETPGWGVPFQQEGYEAWLKVMRINLLAPFFLAQACAPLLEQSPCGAIVNVSSMYGLVGPDSRLYEGLEMVNPAAYTASKGGVIALTRWLSTVLAPTVRVNTVTPGGVERGQAEVFIERYKAKTPLGRMAVEGDVAQAITFLLSPEASYITGQNLVVDGGWTAW